MSGLVFHVITHVEYLPFVTSTYIYKASTSSFSGECDPFGCRCWMVKAMFNKQRSSRRGKGINGTD